LQLAVVNLIEEGHIENRRNWRRRKIGIMRAAGEEREGRWEGKEGRKEDGEECDLTGYLPK
jgi:hypothetical protein